MNDRRRFLQVLGSGVVVAGVGCNAPVALGTSTGTGAGGGGGAGGATSSSAATTTASASASSGGGAGAGGGCGTGGATSQGTNGDLCHSDRGRFDLGLPSDYAADGFHKVTNKSANVLVVRDAGGLYALSSYCTHQCCDMNTKFGSITTVNGQPAIKCLCHNSKFLADGSVSVGPATVGLDAHPLSVGCDGELHVDTSVIVPSSQRLMA
jgi:nitrite reductase/ring-hydroxylating ferredoxin subunit